MDRAYEFFGEEEPVRRSLDVLRQVGLGYLRLGQPATELSGGEAQRIKLATELHKSGTVYVMDEPTTGLHMSDIQHLLDIVDRLVNQGNSVVVIEHNLDVIKTADRLIDMGPEGGEEGGRLLASGTPEEVAAVADSATGGFLRSLVTPKQTKRRAPGRARLPAAA